jgi:hypothetical protein
MIKQYVIKTIKILYKMTKTKLTSYQKLKTTDSKILRCIWVVWVIIVISILMVLKASSREVRYLVLVDDGDLRNISSRTYDNLDEVSNYFMDYTGHQLDTTKLFTANNVYFQYRTGNRIFYCEKKKLITKKNGKEVLQAIKKKELLHYNKVK